MVVVAPDGLDFKAINPFIDSQRLGVASGGPGEATYLLRTPHDRKFVSAIEDLAQHDKVKGRLLMCTRAPSLWGRGHSPNPQTMIRSGRGLDGWTTVWCEDIRVV
jgi:hypothetical protein